MIEIYGAAWCGYCNKAKQLCESLDVKFNYYDVDKDDNKAKLFARMETPPQTIPQIFVDDEHLEGGFTGLQQHLEEKAA